ncbi:MAG: hypothetical protein Q4D44_02480 [Eubacteriales bacterium]|nr:hypothetical protein [Eubacteriales bacterium]
MNFTGFAVGDSLMQQLNAMEKNARMPHAVIISGGDEENRAELTALLSMWAVCTCEGEKPCGECRQCVKARSQNHMDIYYAKGKGKTDSISVDEVRNIVRDSVIIPGEAKRKVYVLSNADKRMGKEALNAFLKTLEEPTGDTLFLLTAENPKALPVTILSRCALLNAETKTAVDEETLALALEICQGIVATSELSLLKSTSQLSTRQKALEVLSTVRLILSDALALSVGGEPLFHREAATALRQKLTKSKIINLTHATQNAINKTNRNLNPTILTTWLCGEYRRITWQK